MEIQENTRDGVLIVSLAGRLDSNTSQQFEDALLGRIHAGSRRIVLDFDKLEYISSAGLRVLLKSVRELKGTNGKMALCAIRDYIQEVFELSGFSAVFVIAANVDDALAKV